MDQQPALDLINAYVDGWRANDLTRILDTLTEDCLIIESHGPTYRGREHVRLWVTTWFAAGQTIDRWDVTSVVVGEDRAAFEWTFMCSGGWGTASFDGATVVRFEQGRIASLREYRCTESPYLWTP